MKKLAILSLVTVAALAIAGGYEGRRMDMDAYSVTGGVTKATCKVGEIARLDYSLDGAGSLDLVRAVGGSTISTTNIVTAANATSGSIKNLGIVGANDYIKFTCSTNVKAKIYIIAK